MSKVQLFPITYTKADLERAPPNEAKLYLLLGHAANDLNILSRLAIFAMAKEVGSQSLCIARATRRRCYWCGFSQAKSTRYGKP